MVKPRTIVKGAVVGTGLLLAAGDQTFAYEQGGEIGFAATEAFNGVASGITNAAEHMADQLLLAVAGTLDHSNMDAATKQGIMEGIIAATTLTKSAFSAIGEATGAFTSLYRVPGLYTGVDVDGPYSALAAAANVTGVELPKELQDKIKMNHSIDPISGLHAGPV